MNAKDVMTRDIITVGPSTKVKDLAMILIKNQISGAPVADKTATSWESFRKQISSPKEVRTLRRS